MKKNVIRFGILSIIITQLLIISNISVITNAQINKSLIENNDILKPQKQYYIEEKPDLEIIEAIGITRSEDGFWEFHVINKGNAPCNCNGNWSRSIDIEITTKKFRSNETVDYYYRQLCFNIDCEETKIIDYIYPPDCYLGIYRCFFYIDAGNNHEEWNEENNKVWAYYLFYMYFPIRISELKYWKTGNEGIKPQSVQIPTSSLI